MTEESEHMLEQLSNNTYCPNHSSVAVVTTGIGSVYAAMEITKNIITNPPDVILNVGCAGAHNPSLAIGDVIVGNEVIPTSNVIVDHMNNFKLYGVRNRTDSNSVLSWKSDERLLNIMSDIILKTQSDPDMPFVTLLGRIASSDTWNDNVQTVTRLYDRYETQCEEMEAASIGQIANHYSIPFLPIKDISNSVHVTENIFTPHEHIVPHICGKNAAVVAKMLVDTLLCDTTFEIN